MSEETVDMDLDDEPSSCCDFKGGDEDTEPVSRFQKETRELQLLPYYHNGLESELDLYLEKMEFNLVKAIACSDLQVGFNIYCNGMIQ